MLPPNPLLQLVPSRVLAAVERVERMIWTPVAQLTAEATVATPQHLSLLEASRRPRRPLRGPQHWGKLFDQRWVHVTLPRARPGGSLFLEWRDQGEATLHVNGVQHYGFDVAHRRCPLPRGVRDVWLESLCVRSAIWHPDASAGLDREGSRCDGAWLVARDEQAWRVFHDLNVLAESMTEERKANFPLQHTFDRFRHQTPVENVGVLYRRLLRLLEEAVDALDFGGLAALEKKLRAIYRKLRELCTQFPIKSALAAEFCIHPDETALRLNGCGIVLINPPFKFEQTLERLLTPLHRLLKIEPRARAQWQWLKTAV